VGSYIVVPSAENSFAFPRKLGYSRTDVMERTSMNLILLSSAGIFAFLGIAFLLLFRKLTSDKRQTAPLGDLENLFAPSRYKPMERLLDPADSSFLSSQPACTRGVMRRFRASRLGIFRGYARCLGRDFTRVSSALKMIMIHAPVDRSALAGLLLKQRLVFSFGMMSLQFRLVLHSFGWSAPQADVRNLVEALDALRSQLRTVALTMQPSASAA
jgi:hypothetical protein